MNKYDLSHPPKHGNDIHVDTLEKSTIQERHPDWPKLDVSFYFSPHGHADNFKEVPQLVSEADIYLIELFNNSGAVEQFLQYIADHPRDTLEQTIDLAGIHGDVLEQIVRGVYDTKKAISSIDIPDEPDYQPFVKDYLEVFSQNEDFPIEDTFEGSLKVLDKTTKAHADMQNQREQMMADRFEKKIEQILKERPELKEKDKLKILLTMGSYHTTLRHTLSKQGIQSSRQFSTPLPYVHTYNAELDRTQAHHKEPSQDLLEKAWVETVIQNRIGNIIGDVKASIHTDSMAIYGRDIVSHLSHDQRKQIYETTYTYYYEDEDSTEDDFRHDINQILKSAGADTIPDTPEEITKQLQATQHLSLKGLAGHVRRFRSV